MLGVLELKAKTHFPTSNIWTFYSSSARTRRSRPYPHRHLHLMLFPSPISTSALLRPRLITLPSPSTSSLNPNSTRHRLLLQPRPQNIPPLSCQPETSIRPGAILKEMRGYNRGYNAVRCRGSIFVEWTFWDMWLDALEIEDEAVGHYGG